MNNYDEELLGLEELGDLESLALSVDARLMLEFERLDKTLTECLNYYRSLAGAFYLTTDEIIEFKNKLYSGKMFDSSFNLANASDEQKLGLIDHIKKWCNFYYISRPAYEMVEPYIHKACIRAGLAGEQEPGLVGGVACDEQYDYAFEDCAVYSNAILRFMTRNEIREWVGYVDKGAASNILMRDRYYLSDNKKAKELCQEKSHSMNVWYGRVPRGAELDKFKKVREYEKAHKKRVESEDVSSAE